MALASHFPQSKGWVGDELDNKRDDSPSSVYSLLSASEQREFRSTKPCVSLLWGILEGFINLGIFVFFSASCHKSRFQRKAKRWLLKPKPPVQLWLHPRPRGCPKPLLNWNARLGWNNWAIHCPGIGNLCCKKVPAGGVWVFAYVVNGMGLE